MFCLYSYTERKNLHYSVNIFSGDFTKVPRIHSKSKLTWFLSLRIYYHPGNLKVTSQSPSRNNADRKTPWLNTGLFIFVHATSA